MPKKFPKAKGFLEKAVRGQTYNSGSADLEEVYERLFPKIGRDFVYKEDLYEIIEELLDFVDPDRLSGLDYKIKHNAISQARVYKNLLSIGQDGSLLYDDLIDIDQEE